MHKNLGLPFHIQSKRSKSGIPLGLAVRPLLTGRSTIKPPHHVKVGIDRGGFAIFNRQHIYLSKASLFS